ncbi:GNAT family N-acetyltransferase [Mesorhizobium sp. B1-1-4]|uniref:GNAT family N-acetyltransferase n=1 Tax=Mesorhizobium sp. B1-1-4 TaxID=2589980 RepID=UPI001FEF250A|nr:GNAT family N-acetyltransferase [Mesorhizobium sp. B1-1-4]
MTELYIDELGVSPAFQRQGIARKMLDAMFAIAGRMAAKKPGSAPSRTTVPPARFTSRGRNRTVQRKIL